MIEGHTLLWEAHPEEMRVALERHDEILRSSFEGRDGYVFTGDSFAAAFGSDASGPLRPLDAARHNLPGMRTPMFGRRDDLTHVLELLDGLSLMSLTGIGGTGKTRLALAAAAGAVEAHPDGVWYSGPSQA